MTAQRQCERQSAIAHSTRFQLVVVIHRQQVHVVVLESLHVIRGLKPPVFPPLGTERFVEGGAKLDVEQRVDDEVG